MKRPSRLHVRSLPCWIVPLCAVVLFVSCHRAEPIESDGASSASADGAGPVKPIAVQEPEEAFRVFNSPLAGDWYPADEQALVKEIDEYLSRVTDERLENVCAVIMPHAGYRYSGPTAAYALHQIRNRSFQRVVVIGPSHRVPMENVASVPDYTHYATPLGQAPLDREFMAELRKHREFQTIPSAHEREHSVQIELPLLQHVLGDFRFVPIVVGDLDRPTVRKMGRILRGLIDPQTLVVASSDFTHYGANFGYVPFKDDVPDRLKELDGGAIEKICNKDPDGLVDYLDTTGATICGRCAIGVLLSMLPDDAVVHKLHYDTSGAMLGDFSSSVSYCAFAVTGKWPKGERVAAATDAAGLPEADRARLLRLARTTLTYVLEKKDLPTPEQLGIEVTPAMQQVFGAFVTLHENGELRGCIGEIVPSRPVYRAVMAQAVNAGLNDHRFPPVELPELEEIDFEISALTPAHRVASASEIVLGTHGIVLEKAGHAAVFLPQVAPEQGWDLETTLTHLAQKAGLPGDAWKEGASFEVFEAIVFGEKDEAARPAGD
ncbi:MAG: AmmeMemoRadiSam system protein B [Planctomycetaceae bacterium]|nr:AmmeMemoRadiSam system protein B [Planctomycetaceae bacterium]